MMTSNHKIRKRSVLSVERKFEILQRIEKGATVKQLVAEYDICTATVRRIKRRAMTLHQLVHQGDEIRNKKCIQRPRNEDLEKRVYAWFIEQKGMGYPISDSQITEKAVELNRESGGRSSFKGSRGWLWRFKTRYDINCLKFMDYKSEGDVDTVAAGQFLKDFATRIEQENIEYENIYNMDEVGLLWRALPTKAERRLDDKEFKKDRVTLGFCVNATGDHKLPLLFIHKVENPRSLKHCKDNLPVIFKAQPQAKMDREMFVNWYQNHFKPAVRARQLETNIRGKVVLLLRKCQAHDLSKEPYLDDQFQILFLPPYTDPFLQPISRGVVDKVKRSFRQKMLSKVLNLSDGVKEFYFDYDIKDCIDLLHEAWKEISASNIRNAWNEIIGQAPEETFIMEEPMDPLEPNLQDMISATIGEEASETSVTEFLARCEQAEKSQENEDQESDNEKEKEKEQSFNKVNGVSSSMVSSNCENENKMNEVFKNLMKWSKQQPEYVKLHVEELKRYYDQVK